MARGPKPFVQQVVWNFVNKGYRVAKRQLDSYRDAVDSASPATEAMEESAEGAAEASDNLAGSSRKAASTIDRMKDSSNAAVRGLGQMASKIQSVVTATGAWIALGAVAFVTALTVALGKATSMAIGFEKEMVGVRKTTGLTGEELEDLQNNLLDLQSDLGVGQQELARIAEKAGQLGISGVENITEFTRTVAMMSEATSLTADQAAQSMARIANAFGLPIEEAERLGSAINALSNNTTANAEDLTEVLTRVGKAGADLGFTADQVAGIGATLVDAGIQSRRAGTQLRNIFTLILSKSGEVASQMGTTEEALVSAFQDDPMQALRRYLSALRELPKAQRAAAVEDLFGRENFLAVQTLVQATGEMAGNVERSVDAFREGTSLSSEFALSLKDVSAEWGRIVSKIRSAVTWLGTKLTPALEEVLATLNDWAGGYQEVIRDTDRLQERVEGLRSEMEQVALFETADEGTDEFERRLNDLAEKFPAFAEKVNGELTGIRVDALQQRLAQRLSSATQTLRSNVRQQAGLLDRTVRKYNRLRARIEDPDIEVGTEDYRELRRLEERLDALTESFVGRFADGVEVSREQLENWLDQIDNTAMVNDIADSLDDLIARYRTLADTKQEAAEAPSPGGGAGSFDSLIPSFDETLKQVIGQQTPDLGTAGIDNLERVNRLMKDFQMRLKVLRGSEKSLDFFNKAELQEAETDLRKTVLQALIDYRKALKEAGLLSSTAKTKIDASIEKVQESAKATAEASENQEDAEESAMGWGEALQDAARAVDGIQQLVSALGDVDEQTESVLDGLSGIISSAGRIGSLASEAGGIGALFSSAGGALSALPGLIGVAGGVASIASGLFGGGDDDREKRLQREMAKLRGAIESNTQALNDQLEETIESPMPFEDVDQGDFFDAGVLLENAPVRRGSEQDKREYLAQLEGTGIELFQNATEMFEDQLKLEGDGPFADRNALAAVVQKLESRFREAEDLYGQFGDSIQGLIEEIQFRREQMGQSFDELSDVIVNRLSDTQFSDRFKEGLSEILGNIDLSDQSVMDRLVNALSTILIEDDRTSDAAQEAEETLKELLPEDADLTQAMDMFAPLVGDASPEEYRRLLEFLQGLPEQAGGGEGADSDFTASTAVDQTITEFQANRLLAYQQNLLAEGRTHTQLLRSIASAVGGDAQVAQGLGSGQGGMSSTSGRSGIHIQDLHIAAGDTPESIARKIGEAAESEIPYQQPL